MMTRPEPPRPLYPRRNASPSMPGIRTSHSTTSNDSPRARSSARVPLPSDATSYPASASSNPSDWRRPGSSSTTSTRVMGNAEVGTWNAEHQERRRFACSAFRIPRSAFRVGSFRLREEHLKRRPSLPRRVHPHHPPHVVDGAGDDGEAESRSPARLLGGVERFEDLLGGCRFIDTRADHLHELLI